MNSTINKEEKSSLTIKYSYNPSITPALSKDEAAKKTRGWIQSEVNWNQATIEELVRTKAYICSKLKDGYKVKDNVEEVYFIVLDIDNKENEEQKSLQEFLKLAEKWEFSWFLHTTVNHQKITYDKKGLEKAPVDKFRVWIPLKKPVTREFLKEDIGSFFETRFTFLDGSSFQAERYYMIAPKAETVFHNHLDKNGETVLFDPKDIEKTPTTKKRQGKTKKASEYLSLDMDIVLDDNKTIKRLSEITIKTPVFCPFCGHDPTRGNPGKANAFVNINSAGQYYLFCSSEHRTYWPEPHEIDVNKCTLFFNTTMGHPTAVNYQFVETQQPYYVFKNDADFNNYCAQEKISRSIKDYLPRREIIFDPKLPPGLNDNYFNVFEPSKYMQKDYTQLKSIELTELANLLKLKTPVIYTLLRNVLGKDEYVVRFTNWIASLLQSREKADTAWLISSKEQGVGKDFMFNFILKPLFGEKQSQLMNGSRIAARFNSLDVNCMLRGYNEVFSSSTSRTNSSRKEWLKERITGNEQDIEFKGVDVVLKKNFMNFILFSNNDQPIFLDENDRRYNVIRNDEAERVVDLPIYKTREQFRESVNSEIDSFAEIVFNINYDVELVNTAISNSAKDNIISMSADPYDAFINALSERDVDYFLLDEVFPISKERAMFSSFDEQSSKVLEIESAIANKGAIPATYMNQIMKFHFSRVDYRNALNRLKQKGIVSKLVHFGNNDKRKAYIIEEEVTLVTEK